MDVLKQQNIDVAIIGAGAAGLFCAYRLLTGLDVDGNPKNVTVAVYEARQRIGGRINSVKLHPNSDTVELGAMRYLSNQKLINCLIENVIAKNTLVSTTDFEFVTFYHENGRLRRNLSLEVMKSNLQSIDSKNRSRWVGKSTDSILETVVSDVLMADGFSLTSLRNDLTESHKKWNEMKKTLTYRFSGPYENCLLNDMSLDQVLCDQLDKETYEFIRRCDGYDSPYYSSAGYGFEATVEYFTQNCKYRTVKGGLGIVMQYLENEITRLGGKVYRGHKLRAFKKNSSLTPGYELILDIAPKSTKRVIFAKNLILCVPPRGIELLDRSSYLFAKNSSRSVILRNALDSVQRVPCVKLYFIFNEPWWKKSIGEKAKIVSNLPFRESYYIPSERKSGLSAVLVCYVDMQLCTWWKQLQGQDDVRKETTINQANQSNIIKYQERDYEPAKSCVVEEVMSQMRQVHSPDVEVPRPVTTAYVDWSNDPEGAAYHHWKPGAKGWEVAPFTRRPFLDENIFIAGEAYSDRHGWVEGALCSAELVLREWFSMRAPDWLDEETQPYYLGW